MTPAGPTGTDRPTPAVEPTPADPGAAGSGLLVEHLVVRYIGRRTPALAGVSAAIAPGEVLGVAGRTGAGKSTLALAAAGFLPRVVRAKVEGVVRSGSLDLTTATGSDVAGRVGIVFSTPANQLSASKLTVREELAFGLENLGVPREEMDPRIDAVLARLGIAHLADREPFALSGGEQQRVAIASIVAMGDSLLILDEPTAQLDPAGRRTVAAMLRQLATDGTAILCVEQETAVLAAADRVLVLDAGTEAALAAPPSALGTGVLGPLGLRTPTLLALAELAGVPEADRFDEAAVADALRRSGPERLAGWRTRSAEASGASGSAAVTAEAVAPAPAGAGRIEVRDLVHRYSDQVTAVRGVTLAIASGESVAIVGQNGSGKTTLVKHFNGLLRPTSGTVEIAGQDIRDRPVSEVARTVGFVFQNPDEQLFNRSVDREVGFGPRNLRLPAAEVQARVDAAIRATGLDDVRATNPYDLGLSQRKLVALASILAMVPAALILDEPTTGQDGPGIERIGAIVAAYRAAGRTVVAITHDMEFAAEHFARIVVMREGVIVADGPPERVLDGSQAELLASTGLEPPVAARIGARLGRTGTPTADELVAALRRG